MSRKLTPKEERFIAEYLACLNSAEAVRRAGYASKWPDRLGFDLLRKPEIARRVEAGKAKQIERAELSAARVLE